MWHRHILDTAAYREDCDAIFGRFLDHFPYFSMRGEADAQALHDAYADTLDRYREAFGEPPADTWITVDASSKCKRTAFTGPRPGKTALESGNSGYVLACRAVYTGSIPVGASGFPGQGGESSSAGTYRWVAIERFIWTDHAALRIDQRGLKRSEVEEVVRVGHPHRSINRGDADWRVEGILIGGGRFVVVYDCPAGGDRKAARIVSAWR